MSLEDIVEAVQLVQTTDTGQEQRSNAQQLLDMVKGSPESLDLVTGLIDLSQHDMVRHFGLTVLEDSLKYHWNRFDEAQHSSLKNLVLTIMAEGTREMSREEFYIKSKVIDCALLCMLHDWPQKWDSLLEDLVDIGSRSDTQAELVLKLLYDFSVYLIRLNKLGIVVSRSNVTSQRRKQLGTSFRSAIPELFKFLHGATLAQAESYVEARAVAEANTGSEEALAVASSKAMLLQAAIKCVSQFLLWIQCSILSDYPVLPMVSQFMGDPNMVEHVVTVMKKLLFRKHLRANEPYVMELFDYVPLLFEVLSEPMFESLARVHALNTDVISVLVELGMLQLRLWRRGKADRKSDADAPEPSLHNHFMSYVESLMALSDAHPSLQVQTLMVKFWRRFLDSGLLEKGESISESEIMQAILGHAIKVLSLPEPFEADDPMVVEIAKLEFNNADEAASYKKALERRASGIVSALARRDGHGLVAYMVQYVAHVFGSLPNDADIGTDSEVARTLRSLCLMSSTVIRALPRRCLVAPDPETAAHYIMADDSDSDDDVPILTSLISSGLRTTRRSMSLPNMDDPQIQAALARMEAARQGTCSALAEALDGVINFTHPSKVVIANQLRLLTSFTPFLKHYPDQLPATFELAFSYLTYKDPSEASLPVTELTDASIEVRGKAARALHSIIIFVGEKLADGLQDLWSQVQDLDARDELRHEEKACVYELVVISASKSHQEDLQRAVVATILDPLLSQWGSDAFQASLASPQALLTALGILGNDPSTRGTLFSPEHMAFRIDLYFVVTVVYVVTKWSASWRSHALHPYLETLLPALLSLIGTLHAVWESDVLALVPEGFQSVFALPDETSTAMLARASSLPSDHLEPGAQLRLLTYWFDSVHSRAYSALGSIAKVRDLYNEVDLADLLGPSVFSCLPTLPNRYLVGITMSVISSLFRMCPYRMRDAVVGPILVPWLEFIQEKLPAEWGAFYEREQNGSDLTPEEEVLVDKDLGMLTTCHGRLLQTISFRLPRTPRDPNGPAGNGNGNGNSGSANGPAGNDSPPHVLESEPLRSIYLQSAMMLVQTPTLAAVSIAVNVCSRLLPHVSHIQNYQYVLSSELLPALIEALAHCEEDSVVRNILALISRIYESFTQTHPDITRGVLSAVPNVNMDTIQQFEGALEAASSSRARRELFRELLAPVIGSNVVHKMYTRGDEDVAIDRIDSGGEDESGMTQGGL